MDENIGLQAAQRITAELGDGYKAFVVIVDPDDHAWAGGTVPEAEVPSLLAQCLQQLGVHVAVVPAARRN